MGELRIAHTLKRATDHPATEATDIDISPIEGLSSTNLQDALEELATAQPSTTEPDHTIKILTEEEMNALTDATAVAGVIYIALESTTWGIGDALPIILCN